MQSIPESCSVGDHQANTLREVSLREAKSQMRALQRQLDRGLGFALASDDALLDCVPTFSGDVIRVISEVGMAGLLGHE